MFTYKILIQGFPGKSATHGGFGWCTIALVSNGKEDILIDTGGFGVRKLLLQKLEDSGVAPKDIDMVLLTHPHWDHCINWPLFPNAKIVMGKTDLEWALAAEPWSSDVPEFYIKELMGSDRLILVGHLNEFSAGITSHFTNGHTPGHLTYCFNNGEHDLIFCGDAAKNRAELISGAADMSMNESESRESIRYL